MSSSLELWGSVFRSFAYGRCLSLSVSPRYVFFSLLWFAVFLVANCPALVPIDEVRRDIWGRLIRVVSRCLAVSLHPVAYSSLVFVCSTILLTAYFWPDLFLDWSEWSLLLALKGLVPISWLFSSFARGTFDIWLMDTVYKIMFSQILT